MANSKLFDLPNDSLSRKPNRLIIGSRLVRTLDRSQCSGMQISLAPLLDAARTCRPASATALGIALLMLASGMPLSVASSSTSNVHAGNTSTLVPTTLVQDTAASPQYVDPSIDYESAGGNVIQNVNEQLMWFKGADATTEVPWLASSQTVSTDGLTYTYQLRHGIKFSDGTPFNASAVYFSIMRTIIIDDPSSPAWSVDQVLRGAYAYSASYGGCGCGAGYDQSAVNALVAAAPVTINGTYKVSFHLLRPYAAWPFIMAFTVSAIQDPTAVIANWVVPANSSTGVLPANAGGDGLPRGGATAGDYADVQNQWAASHDAGTGPYMLQSWNQTTGDVTLFANPHYWGGPAGSIHPTIQTIMIKVVNDPNTREFDLKTGIAQIASIPIANGQIFDLVNRTRWFATQTIQPIFPRVSVKGPFAKFETDFVGMNQMRKDKSGNVLRFQPFQDVRVRTAMAYLWDDVAYDNQAYQGFSPLATQILPPGMFGYDSGVTPVQFNITKAENLLLAAGPADGFGPTKPKTITVYYNIGNTVRQAAANILASDINSIATATGLYASIIPLPFPQYLHAIATHQADVWALGWIVDYVDPDDLLVPFASGTAGTFAIWSGFNNATISSWVAQQATIANSAARASLINEIEAAITNGHYYLWTTNGVALNIARTSIYEKPTAFIASNIGNDYLASLYGYYYASIK